MLHLVERVLHAQLDDLIRVRAARRQSRAQFIFARRHHKEIHKTPPDLRLLAGPHLIRALHIDVHHDIHSRFKIREHLGLERSVKISMHGRMLQKIPRIQTLLEIGSIQKMIIAAIHLT